MKQRAIKIGLIVFEAAALLAAVGAAGGFLLYWRLQQGPVSLTLLEPAVEAAVVQRLPKGYAASVDNVSIVQLAEDYRIRIERLAVSDPAGETAASADAVDVVFSFRDFLSGRIGPREARVSGAAFRIVRNREQAVDIPLVELGSASREQGRSRFDIQRLFHGSILKSAFERAELIDAEVVFFDAASGRSWTSKNAAVVFTRTDAGLRGVLSGDIDLSGTRASIRAEADYDADRRRIAADIVGAQFPIGDILTTFYGDGADILDAPVSGRAIFEFTPEGETLSADFEARIDKGALRLGGEAAPIEFVDWRARFDPEADHFAIDSFAYDIAGNRGLIEGGLSLEFGDDVRDPKAVRFDLTGSEIVVDAGEALPAPLDIESAGLQGRYDVEARRIEAEALRLALLDIEIAGSLGYTAPRPRADGSTPSPGVEADIAVEGALDPQRLLRIWPKGVGEGARVWVADRLESGRVDNIKAVADLKPGAVGEDGLVPDKALTVTFDVADAKAYYVKEMTPLTGASGSGVLRGNSFKLVADRARVGAVSITQGEVDFPVFIPKWRETFFRFTARGASEEILGVLDQEPLLLLSKINLSPDQFVGDASARIEIMRPNRSEVDPEEYRYSGEATFENMRISNLAGDADLTGGVGAVTLKPRSLTVDGTANFADAPVDILWKQNFFDEDGPSELVLSGSVDAGVADLFGLSLRRFLRGPVDLTARAVGEIGDFSALFVEGDFADAALSFDTVGWRKPAGAPATGSVMATFSEAGPAIQSLNVAGAGVAINGSLAMENGALKRASFPNFFLNGAADFSLTVDRDPSGGLALRLLGKRLNAAPVLEEFFAGGAAPTGDESAEPWGPGLTVTARIDELIMREGVAYRDASLDLWRDEARLQALDFSALDPSGLPLKLAMNNTGEDAGPSQAVTAETGDLGALLRGLFAFDSIEGGAGIMTLGLGDPAGGIGGVVEARGLQIVNAPLLARVFSAGSFDGLASLVNGEGIDLAAAYGEFDYRGDRLRIRNFRATGPSVGLTADGVIGAGDNAAVDLKGAVAPVYQLNSFLGNTPLIGDLFVNKKGEGLLAVSYSVTGDRAAPNVFVNPLSALTPGVFRNLFDPDSYGPAEPD